MWFLIGVLVFVICSIIQFLAMNRMAFGRSIFIAAMFLVMAVIARLSTSSAAGVFVGILLVLGYAFLFLMTWKSIVRFRKTKRTSRG
ncbi:MAG: hypothetical protein JWN30_1958 [Bacilli bacterium]|nr:hypothetical protein [Bacilli bacterium]